MRYEYLPTEAAQAGHPHIMVDSAALPSSVLELSHWPDNKTPVSLKDDTSTQIVFRFLEQDDIKASTKFVSNDHYDIDGLLSIWVMMEPDLAMTHRNHIEAISFTGDFDHHLTDKSARSCLAFDYVERQLAKKINGMAETPDGFTVDLISGLFPFTQDCILTPEKFEGLWKNEYSQLQESIELQEKGLINVEIRSDIGLAIIHSPKPVHRYVLNKLANESLVLYAIRDRFQEMYYRYESFVDFQSAPYFPRIKWNNFVKNYNLGGSEGRWLMESPYTAHPSLRFYRQGVGHCSPDMSFETIRKDVISYLEENKGESVQAKDWTLAQDDVLPPNYRYREV